MKNASKENSNLSDSHSQSFKGDKILDEIENEKKRANEKLADLILFVNERCKKKNPTSLNYSKEQNLLVEHSKQVLEKCIEQGIKKDLAKRSLLKLEIAAILQDLNKNESSPKWAEGIENFMLVYAGEAVAEELATNKKLRKILKKNLGEENFNEDINHLQQIIKSHTGPNPGFMNDALRVVNARLRERGIDLIVHPLLEEGDQVAEILLVVNVYLFASSIGIQETINVRNRTPFLQKQDENLSAEYEQLGVGLSFAEAALIKTLDSVYEARDMIREEEDIDWIQSAIEKAKQAYYEYEIFEDKGKSYTVLNSIPEVEKKRKRFEDLKRLKSAEKEENDN